MANLPLVAAINDMSGFGRCSLTVAMPILSVMGLQCCPLPTAILSNHTGYESFHFVDFTDHMKAYGEQWQKLGLDFAAIYSGFLGSEKQVEIVISFIQAFNESQNVKGIKAPLVIVDPVMGDNGDVYTTYTTAMCNKMKELVSKADIVTPNLTESCILLGEKYCGETISLDFAKGLAEKLCAMGPKIAVITGIKRFADEQGEINKVAVLAYEKSSKAFYLAENDLVSTHFNGTGDVFASVLCGALVNGIATPDALEKAAKFVYTCAKYTAEHNGSVGDGVMIEKFLRYL